MILRAASVAFVVAALWSGAASAVDCMDRFPEGRFGVPLAHPAIRSTTPALEGFAALYLAKQTVTIARPEDCDYVYTADVFRLVETPAGSPLLAGCVGDFDGDGRPDVALLMKRRIDGLVIPVVFRSRGAGYEITQLERVTDPYGFNEDRSVWPGPFCTPKPPTGIFESEVGGKVSVVGDVFTIGWETYFWNRAGSRFDGILTSD